MFSLIVIALITLIIYFKWLTTYWSRFGVKGPGFFGGVYTYTKVVRDVCQDWHNRFGKVVGYYEMSTKCLQISDAQLIHDILNKDFDKFCDRRYCYLGDFMDDCIVLKRGLEWAKVRSVLSPCFTSLKSKKMLNSLPILVDNFILTLRESSKGKAFNIKANIESLVINTMMASFFNIKTDDFHEPKHPIVVATKPFFSQSLTMGEILSFLFPILGKILKVKPVKERSTSFFGELFKDLLKNRGTLNNSNPNLDLVNMILENNKILKENTGKGLTDNEVIAQLIIIMLLENDTLATALCHSFFYMAKHPDLQQKLFNEISTIDKLDIESLKSVEYLNAFIDEVLRIDPPINRFDRQCTQDYTLGDTGIVVPKGTLITVCAYTLHRNPEYFPEPDQFKPERFMKGNEHQYNPKAYLPFGDGPKTCLAIQYAKHKLRYIIAKTVMEFQFAMPDDFKKMDYATGTVVNLPCDLMMKVHERFDNNKNKLQF